MPAARLVALLCLQSAALAADEPTHGGVIAFLKNSNPIALVLLFLFVGTWVTLLVIFFPALLKRFFRTLTTRTSLILIALVTLAVVVYRVKGRPWAENVVGADFIDFIQADWPAIAAVTLFLLLLCGGRPLRFLLRLFLE